MWPLNFNDLKCSRIRSCQMSGEANLTLDMRLSGHNHQLWILVD
jgi:hypothetical protein